MPSTPWSSMTKFHWGSLVEVFKVTGWNSRAVPGTMETLGGVLGLGQASASFSETKIARVPTAPNQMLCHFRAFDALQYNAEIAAMRFKMRDKVRCDDLMCMTYLRHPRQIRVNNYLWPTNQLPTTSQIDV